MISRAAFHLATEQEDSQVFLLAMSSTQEPIDPAKHPDYPANLVPSQYHDFLSLFTKKGADKLPPHRYVDHEIPLEDDKNHLWDECTPCQLQNYKKSANGLRKIYPKGSFVQAPHPVPHPSYLSKKRMDRSASV